MACKQNRKMVKSANLFFAHWAFPSGCAIMWMMIKTHAAGAKGGRICTTDLQKTVSPGTVIHYHANIHKALKYAVKMDLIPFNPADKGERPKKQRYIADYYRQEELERLLEASKDHPYSLLIQMTAFYGLRRSEALGLKWDAIDFERDTITIKHIVTNAKIDGKCEIVCADRAKTKSSLRSLPLVSNIREKLLALREQQKENRRVCGNCYSKKYDGYVFNVMDNILTLPDTRQTGWRT